MLESAIPNITTPAARKIRPCPAAHPEVHSDRDENGDPQHQNENGVACQYRCFRLEEIHPEEPGDERHRHKERRDDRERFHDFVHAIAHHG
jgi:hypothetical protein